MKVTYLFMVLMVTTGIVSHAIALEFDAEGYNALGYQGTNVHLKAGYYLMTNGADIDEGLLIIRDPMGNIISESEIIDDTAIYEIVTKNKFNWGLVVARYVHGLKDGSNNDGYVIVGNTVVNTFKSLKIYGGFEQQYFKDGRNVKHLRYGIGFGAPVLNGQLLMGYLAKRHTQITTAGYELIDGDNGYVLGLKADYKFNDSWTWKLLTEFAWERQYTEVTPAMFPSPLPAIRPPEDFPLYALSAENLTDESIKISNSLTYKVTTDFEVGVEYKYMKGEAVLLHDPGMLGAFVQYNF